MWFKSMPGLPPGSSRWVTFQGRQFRVPKWAKYVTVDGVVLRAHSEEPTQVKLPDGNHTWESDGPSITIATMGRNLVCLALHPLKE